MQKGFNKTFLNLYLRSAARRMNKNKTSEMIKNELIASILEVFEAQNDSQMNEKVKMRRN